jgi:hypothetical protein
MYEDEWNELVGAGARECLDSRNYNKVKLLPLVEDVIKLYKHIDVEVDKVKNTADSSALEKKNICKNV